MAAAHQINLIIAFRRLLLRALAPLLLLLFIARPGIALQVPPSTLHLAEPPAVNVLAAPNILSAALPTSPPACGYTAPAERSMCG